MIMYIGWFVGDPHLVTLDGVQYTFNGKGEFILITTTTTIQFEDRFVVQGRMVPLATATQPNSGTVFSSISVLAGYDVIEMRADDERILVLINGTHSDLPIGLWRHQFIDYTIIIHDSSNVRVLLNKGAVSLVLTQSTNHKYFTAITVSVSDTFAGKTTGLLGNNNNDTSDDLLPRNGSWPLPLNSTSQEIHESFGMSCKLHIMIRTWTTCNG